MSEEILKKALDNDKNESILSMDTNKIIQSKKEILEQLNLPKNITKQIQTKLSNYRFIDHLKDLHFGSYIRWISLKNPEKIILTNGGILCDIKEFNNNIIITCKNYMNRFFQLKMNECIIFQKLSDQESLLLKVIDYLHE